MPGLYAVDLGYSGLFVVTILSKNKCITYLYPTISTLFTRILRFYVTEKWLDAFNDKPFVVVAQIKKKSDNNKCIYNTVLLEKRCVYVIF